MNILLKWQSSTMGPTIPPLLPLSRQNMLDHVNAFIKPWKSYFGDLDLLGPFAIFSLV